MIAVIFQIIGWLITFAFNAVIYIYAGMMTLIDLMSKPFGWAKDKIKGFLAKKITISDDLNKKFRAVNGFAPFILLMSALLFSAVAFAISSLNWDKNDNYLTYMLYNTTLGSVSGFLSEGLPFTPATLVAIAFSGMLLPMCMNAHNQKEKKAPIYIRIPCYVVYLVAGSILAMILSPVFQAVGDWGYQTIVALFNGLGESIILSILEIIVLIPLCYIALLLCLITIKTYAECIVFGILGTIVLFLVGMLIQLIPEAYATLGEVLLIIFVLGLFFGLDILQSYVVGKIEASFKKNVLKDDKNKEDGDNQIASDQDVNTEEANDKDQEENVLA